MNLEILKDHAYYRPLVVRLSDAEKLRCQAFLDQHGPKPNFAVLLDQWFLDRPKPKHWTLMMELTSAARALSKLPPGR